MGRASVPLRAVPLWNPSSVIRRMKVRVSSHYDQLVPVLHQEVRKHLGFPQVVATPGVAHVGRLAVEHLHNQFTCAAPRGGRLSEFQ